MASLPSTHDRHTIRLQGYDYCGAGGYFVTLITQRRENIFGEITDGELLLSLIGQCAATTWQTLPAHFDIALDAWVLMPNHLHGIIIINDYRRGEAPGRSGGIGKPSFLPGASPLQLQPRGTIPGSLGAIVQNYKSASSYKIHKLGMLPGKQIWQRNYYEHVIRDDAELNRIREYIEANPGRWEQDEENPKRKSSIGLPQS